MVVVLCAASALAQQDVPEMITDRPDATESPQTVPRGYFQVEAGGGFNADAVVQNRIDVDETSFDLLDVLFRLGLSNRVELRLSTLYTFRTVTAATSEENTDGINGIIVGAKIGLMKESGWRPVAGLIVDVGLPVGREDYTGKKALPGFLVAAAHTLGDRFGFGYNLGGRWDSDSNFIFRYSGTLPAAITGSLGAFIEVFGNASSAFKPIVSVDGGFAWQLWPNFQLDAAVGGAITEDGADWFAKAGVSFRLPR